MRCAGLKSTASTPTPTAHHACASPPARPTPSAWCRSRPKLPMRSEKSKPMTVVARGRGRCGGRARSWLGQQQTSSATRNCPRSKDPCECEQFMTCAKFLTTAEHAPQSADAGTENSSSSTTRCNEAGSASSSVTKHSHDAAWTFSANSVCLSTATSMTASHRSADPAPRIRPDKRRNEGPRRWRPVAAGEGPGRGRVQRARPTRTCPHTRPVRLSWQVLGGADRARKYDNQARALGARSAASSSTPRSSARAGHRGQPRPRADLLRLRARRDRQPHHRHQSRRHHQQARTPTD